jgi:hypothetical protein
MRGSFSGFAFFLPPKEDFFSLKGVSTTRPCAAESCMQMGIHAYTDAYNPLQHKVRQHPYLSKFFFHHPSCQFVRFVFIRILSIRREQPIFLIFSKIFSIHEDVAPLGVMIRLRAADESLLSDDAVKLIIKTA